MNSPKERAHKQSANFFPRRLARECVFKGLYALEISKESEAKIFEDVLKRYSFDSLTESFAISLFKETLSQKDILERTISKFLENWELRRVALLDNLILKMAVCELLFFDDVPPKVSISEAIEMAKKYSTDDSSGFVNGILDSVYKEMIKKKLN